MFTTGNSPRDNKRGFIHHTELGHKGKSYSSMPSSEYDLLKSPWSGDFDAKY